MRSSKTKSLKADESKHLLDALKRTEHEFIKYKQALASFPYSGDILSILYWKESLATLRSQKINATLSEVLYYHCHRSKRKKIPHQIQRILQFRTIFSSRTMLQHARISISFLEMLHGKIEKHSTQHPSDIGKIRKRQNWIGPIGCTEQEAHYLPPPASELRGRLQKFIRSFNQKKIDYPLLHLASLFAQFLAIHPFMDANGRMARLLLSFFLFWRKETSRPIFGISDYFFTHRNKYCGSLFNLSSKNKRKEWFHFFLKSVAMTAKKQSKEIRCISNLYATMYNALINFRKRKQILRLLFTCPVLSKTTIRQKLQLSSLQTNELVHFLKKNKWLDERRIHKKAVLVFLDILEI
jgi:Fic family protein